MLRNVIVISPHPDDETLGAGGTLLKHKALGDKIYWLIATRMGEECGYTKREILRRRKEIEVVAEKYGFGEVYELGFLTTKMDQFSMREIMEKISSVLEKVKPAVIYLPFSNDVHSDHRVIFKASCGCLKPFRYPFAKKILMMEILSGTEFAPGAGGAFVPDYFVDITNFLDKKLEIMRTYASELGEHPFPRNVDNISALATFRGATAGVKHAEAFMLLKEVW